MSGGALGNEESVLETPTYVLALVLLGFQIAAFSFTFVVNSLKKYLRKHQRHGMLEAVEHSVMELTLLGFISLCLIALQTPLSNICIPISSGRANWAILNNVIYKQGMCDCCLMHTEYIQSCTLDYAKCGNPTDKFCNCNNQDPTCVSQIFGSSQKSSHSTALNSTGEDHSAASNATTEAILHGEAMPPVADAAHHRRRSQHRRTLFQTKQKIYDALYANNNNNNNNKYHNHRRSLLSGGNGEAGLVIESCAGPVSIISGCPEGQMPAFSMLALEQVHLLIFTVSLTHVLCGFLLYFAATCRLRFQWKRWEDMDDPHSRRVRQILDNYFKNLNVTPVSRDVSSVDVAGMIRDTGEEQNNPGDGGNSGGDGGYGGEERGNRDTGDGSANEEKKRDLRIGASPFDERAEDLNASSLSSPPPFSGEQRQQSRGLPALVPMLSRTKSRKLSASESSRHDGPLPSVLPTFARSASWHHRLQLQRRRSFFSEEDRVNSLLRGDHDVAKQAKTRFEKFAAYMKEMMLCMFWGLTPRVVQYEQYVVMRASFLYTHKLGEQFAFLDHVHRSLEDDLSHVVGLSIEFWLVSILFILVSGPYGYAVMPFMVIAACIVVPTNAKLVKIIRSVSNRGGAQMLSSGVFWLNKPQLMLIPIKLCLFLCAFIYASFIFFAWQFGTRSCPFTDAFYPNWVIPWWTIPIVNTIIFVYMGAVTLPAYSLAVQMGSDIKSYMLPQKLTKKLLAVAAAAKEKVKADKARREALPKQQGAKAFSGSEQQEQQQEIDGNMLGGEESEVQLGSSDIRSSMTMLPRESRFDRMVSIAVRHLVGDEHK